MKKNPFIEGLKLSTGTKKLPSGKDAHSEIVKDGQKIISEKHHEYLSNKYISYENEKFIKVFPEQRSHLIGLSHKSFQMLEFIYAQVLEKPRADAVYIRLEDVQKCFSMFNQKISRTSLHRAIKQLIEYEVISDETGIQNLYFINPRLLFNGDRLKYVRDSGG